MSEIDEAHGWKPLGFTVVTDAHLTPGQVFIGEAIPERARCACVRTPCQRRATEEDLLCDGCRADCEQVA